jgi:hypothetical protein
MRLRNSTGAAAGKIILAGDRQHRPFEFLERSPANADYLSRSGEHHSLGESPNDGRSISNRPTLSYLTQRQPCFRGAKAFHITLESNPEQMRCVGRCGQAWDSLKLRSG